MISPPVVLERENLIVRASFEGSVVLQLQGVIRDSSPDQWLSPLMEDVEDAVQRGAATMVVDLQELEYMNAVGFRILAGWLKRLCCRVPPCEVTLRASRRHRWQAMALPALRGVVGRELQVEHL